MPFHIDRNKTLTDFPVSSTYPVAVDDARIKKHFGKLIDMHNSGSFWYADRGDIAFDQFEDLLLGIAVKDMLIKYRPEAEYFAGIPGEH